MARILRRSATVGLATALIAFNLGIAPAVAGAESKLVNKTNAARQAAGKAPLQVYWDLTDDARAHSKKMADRQELFHNPNLGSVTDGWKALGENIGVGPSIDAIFDAFMNSSSHRSNILGGYNYIGVGVKEDSDGKLWVTMIFMRGDEGLLDPDPTTTTTTTTTTTQPPSTTTTTKPPSTTTTTKPPSTTTTTKPPSTTTTQPPSSTTTTTTSAPVDGVTYEVSEEELLVLSSDWIPPTLFGVIGRVGR